MQADSLNNATLVKPDAGLEDLALVREFVRTQASALGLSQGKVDDLVLAVDEAVTNILMHGYQGLPGYLEIVIFRSSGQISICLRDRARPFDPRQAPDPDLTIPLEHRKLGGMGVYFIKQLIDQLDYRVLADGGNELTLTQNIEGDKQYGNDC
jgi:serine/threonine-protein kinase RsbW